MDNFNPVSLAEISELTGLTRQKLASYKFHGKLPEPRKVLKCGPLWDKEEVVNHINTVGFHDNRTKVS